MPWSAFGEVQRVASSELALPVLRRLRPNAVCASARILTGEIPADAGHMTILLSERETEEEVNPERAALLSPYRNEHAGSLARTMGKAARPQSLPAYVNWARWAYGSEPP